MCRVDGVVLDVFCGVTNPVLCIYSAVHQQENRYLFPNSLSPIERTKCSSSSSSDKHIRGVFLEGVDYDIFDGGHY